MFGNRQAFGLDIGDDAWRIVALRRGGGRYEVTYAARLSLPDDPSGALAMAMREAGSGRRVAVGLPASGCAFKTASLPPGNRSALAQVARFEAENQFPLPLRELVWDFALSPEPSGRRHALIAGARRALVDERLALLRGARAVPGLLLPTPLAAIRTVEQPDEPYLLVLAGSEWTDLCRYEGERLRGCRSVLAGDPNAEGWADRLTREIRPWQLAEGGINRIVLLGTAPMDAAKALASGAGLTVMTGNPWQAIRDPQGYLHELEGPPAAYATAVGLAMTALERRPSLNLLPAQLIESRRRERRLTWALAAWALALVLLAPVAWSGHVKLGERQASLREVQSRVKELQGRVDAPEPGMLAAREVATSLRRPESQPLEVLRLLSMEMPEGIALSNLACDRGKSVVLKGRADSNPTLATAVRALNNLVVFERATLDYSNLIKGEDAQAYDFQITCILPADRAAGGKQPRKGLVVR